MSTLRERLLAEMHIWEEMDFTKELYAYIETEIARTQGLIVVSARNKEYEQAHEHIGYQDALRIVRAFAREWVEENSDDE